MKAGLAYLYRGEHGPAEACFRRAEALLEADTWLRWRWQIALLHAWGELALTQGRPDQAWPYAIQSLALATQTDSRKHIVRAQRLQGEVLVARGRLEEAAQTLVTSVHGAEQIQTPREVWLGQAALGKVLTQLGRDQEAEAQLTQATQTIEAMAATLAHPALAPQLPERRPGPGGLRHLGTPATPAKRGGRMTRQGQGGVRALERTLSCGVSQACLLAGGSQLRRAFIHEPGNYGE